MTDQQIDDLIIQTLREKGPMTSQELAKFLEGKVDHVETMGRPARMFLRGLIEMDPNFTPPKYLAKS